MSKSNHPFIRWARKALKPETRRAIVRYTRWPPVGAVRFGSFRRLRPISEDWGEERGQAIDRYYIEGFLESQRHDVRGRVLEIGESRYTRRFGGSSVNRIDVLHVAEENPEVTIIGDLTHADHVQANQYDCVIVTQTLQLIYRIQDAVQTLHRILKPGGVALVTVPGITKISRYDMERWGQYWSLTSRSARSLFEEAFGIGNVVVQVYGNVLASVSFLHGLASQELKHQELDFQDPDFELLIAVRAVKR